MLNIQLDEEEQRALLIFLGRVDLKGTEAEMLTRLQYKTRNAAKINVCKETIPVATEQTEVKKEV